MASAILRKAWQGKWALVTGASAGIGEAFAAHPDCPFGGSIVLGLNSAEPVYDGFRGVELGFAEVLVVESLACQR